MQHDTQYFQQLTVFFESKLQQLTVPICRKTLLSWHSGLRNFARKGAWVAVITLGALPLFQAAFPIDFERLRSTISQRFPPGAISNFNDWRQLLSSTESAETEDKLKRVNEFFNRRIQFGEDQQIWGQPDYWATPMETLGKGMGDCEDYSIAKYFTLLALKIPNEQLRLVYVRARIGGPSSSVQQAHMVLAYYASPDADPLVLDNLITDIRPASRRRDLAPIFSFSSEGIWAGAAGTAQSTSDTGRLSRWQDLLRRARAEGFD